MERHQARASDSMERHQERASTPPRVQTSSSYKHETPSNSKLFVPYRVAAECGIIIGLSAWALICYAYYNAWHNGPSCVPPQPHAGVGRSPVAIMMGGYLAWSVNDNGMVELREREEELAAEQPTRQAFHLEWMPGSPLFVHHGSRDGSYFCLRYLRDMRLLEAVPPGGPDAFVLRVSNRYSCDASTSAFQFRGGSLYALGVQSFVNHRANRILRAHGDNGPPWKPLTQETKLTRAAIEPLPDRRDYIERSLLQLVARLENQTRGS